MRLLRCACLCRRCFGRRHQQRAACACSRGSQASPGRRSERGGGPWARAGGGRRRGGCWVAGWCWRRSLDAQEGGKALRGCVDIDVDDEQSEVAGPPTELGSLYGTSRALPPNMGARCLEHQIPDPESHIPICTPSGLRSSGAGVACHLSASINLRHPAGCALAASGHCHQFEQPRAHLMHRPANRPGTGP